MEMNFEKGKVYEFELDRPVISGDKNYFMLTYGPEKAKTIPGYANDHMQFRVEVQDFQTDWNRWKAGTKIPCYVKDYKQGGFPHLVQDMESLLKKYYTPGGTYTFTVSNRQANQDPDSQVIWYDLTDGNGMKHSFPSGKELSPGSDIELTVDKISYKLEFVNEVKKQIRENFKIGEVYEFEILDKKTDPKSEEKYFLLKDFICNYSVHRYYYEGQLSPEDTEGTEDRDPKYQPGVKLKLKVQDYMKNGWAVLALPRKSYTPAQLQQLEMLPFGNPGLESNLVEYKSSIVFAPGRKQDIDTQLGYEIMREIASFMNSSGGLLCIGFRDDGEPVGIEKDLPLLQTGTLPEGFKYPPTWDSYERRIRLMIVNKLGATANALLEKGIRIGKRKDSNGVEKPVCIITVPQSPRPIYLNRSELYKRCGNMCQKLQGDDITYFICNRMKNANLTALAADIAPQKVQVQEAVKKEVETLEKKGFTPITEKEKTIPVQPAGKLSGKGFYLTFAENENTVTRSLKPAADRSNVLHEIFIDNIYKNASGYLLLCYANGRIRFQNPARVVRDKPHKDYPYAYGYCTEAEFTAVHVCSKNDYLVVRSQDSAGRRWIKAVAVGEYNYAKSSAGSSFASKGNMIVNEDLAKVESFEIVPEEESAYIYPIIKYRNTQPGFPEDDPSLRDVIAFLDPDNRNSGSQADL